MVCALFVACVVGPSVTDAAPVVEDERFFDFLVSLGADGTLEAYELAVLDAALRPYGEWAVEDFDALRSEIERFARCPASAAGRFLRERMRSPFSAWTRDRVDQFDGDLAAFCRRQRRSVPAASRRRSLRAAYVLLLDASRSARRAATA